MTFDKAAQAFKNNPSAENAWVLQQAMVSYAGTFKPEAITKAKTKKSSSLKTCKGGKWDKLLKEIVELFKAFECEVVPHKANSYLESWKVIDKNRNQAILYLGSSGFSMGAEKSEESLKGCFESYDNQEIFNDFLVNNDIEIDD